MNLFDRKETLSFVEQNPEISNEIIDFLTAFETIKGTCQILIDRKCNESIIYKNFKHKLEAKEKPLIEAFKDNDVSKFVEIATWSKEELQIIDLME